jgi:hypothetical protein
MFILIFTILAQSWTSFKGETQSQINECSNFIMTSFLQLFCGEALVSSCHLVICTLEYTRTMKHKWWKWRCPSLLFRMWMLWHSWVMSLTSSASVAKKWTKWSIVWGFVSAWPHILSSMTVVVRRHREKCQTHKFWFVLNECNRQCTCVLVAGKI